MTTPKIKAYLIAVSMLLLAAIQAGAQTFKYDDMEYKVIDTDAFTCELVACRSTSSDVKIPSTVYYESEKYTVTAIGDDAFFCNTNLTSVEIPNSVTKIGMGAFAGCENLSSVIIPNSVIEIGKMAFEYCTSLKSIEIPNSVTKVGIWAFRKCSAMTEIIVNSDNEIYSSLNGVLYNKEGTTLLQYPCGLYGKFQIPETATSIGDYAFASCYGLTSIVIPKSVIEIGEHAFEGCSALREYIVDSDNDVYSSLNGVLYNKEKTTLLQYPCGLYGKFQIPETVTSIGNYAFKNCYMLTAIELPNSVTMIGEDAFFRCTGLTAIEIPNSVTEIGESAFLGCENLITIVIPNSITEIGNSAFYGCENLITIVIPNSVTKIGDYAFYHCSAMTAIEIPNSVTIIGNSAFSDCKSLTSINIPNSVTKIGDWAFTSCTGLTAIEIPNSVTEIGMAAFYGCSGITAIEIHNSVTEIGRGAFWDCSGLCSITYNAENPIEGDANIFSSETYENATLFVSAKGYNRAKEIDPWRNFRNIEISGFDGIEDIPEDEADCEFFDLNGRRIKNPSNGIYIRRNGTDYKKVLIN